jgi:hypothetical protein
MSPAAYANRYLRSLRQIPKYELGMSARAFKPAGGPRKGLVANPQSGFAYGNLAGVTVGNNEELERKARFFAVLPQKMRPNS